MTTTVERKLTTILCADVAGYSRLMEQDEEGTLASLKSARSVFNAQITDHGGRLINMTGDAIIAEFPSVVNAVHCAVAIQNQMSDLHEQNEFAVALHFRIGLNLGDVMIEGDDIFGDGVNIAARLEALAPTGGICISGTVYDHVKGKFPAGFDYLGERKVKNIDGAVSVYTLQLAEAEKSSPPPKMDADAASAADETHEEKELRRQIKRQASFYRRCLTMGVLVIFLFIINMITSPGTLWFFWPALPILFTLTLNGFRVFSKTHFSDEWERRRLEKIKRHQDHRSHRHK